MAANNLVGIMSQRWRALLYVARQTFAKQSKKYDLVRTVQKPTQKSRLYTVARLPGGWKGDITGIAPELGKDAAWKFASTFILGKAVRGAGQRMIAYAFVALGITTGAKATIESLENHELVLNLFESKDFSTTPVSLEDFEIGPMITNGKGQCGAVFQARLKRPVTGSLVDLESKSSYESLESLHKDFPLDSSSEEKIQSAGMPIIEKSVNRPTEELTKERKILCDEYNLAIKMMFNYASSADSSSNSADILRQMSPEMIPTQFIGQHRTNGSRDRSVSNKNFLKSHPNLVLMPCAFVADTPDLPCGLLEFPCALPPRLNSEGLGQDRTLFLVMKRYDQTLESYLSAHSPSIYIRTLLIRQLIEAIIYLGDHQVAHRDIKSDNILLSNFADCIPQLALCDFGCAISGNLKIPFDTEAISRGGNPALMAPEIKTAGAGRASYLDYHKSDLWAVGAMAYEILGAPNPFNRHSSLDSASYEDNQLPPLPSDVPEALATIIKLMLRRDPSKRPDARNVAAMFDLLLWAPQSWLSSDHYLPQYDELRHWFLNFSSDLLAQNLIATAPRVESYLKGKFLVNFELESARNCLKLLHRSF